MFIRPGAVQRSVDRRSDALALAVPERDCLGRTEPGSRHGRGSIGRRDSDSVAWGRVGLGYTLFPPGPLLVTGPRSADLAPHCSALPIGWARAVRSGQSERVPPTPADRCDWCYGPLTEADIGSALGRVLGQAEAAACSACVAARLILRTPDSLDPSDVLLTGEDAWAIAVSAVLCDGRDVERRSTAVLRRVAGYH